MLGNGTSWLQTRICRELGQDYGSYLWRDVQAVIDLYAFYDGPGQQWDTRADLDYRPNKTIVNHTKKLIQKVAGFMFGRAPEITLLPIGDDSANEARCAELEQHIRDLLQDNGWKKRLLDAGRDAFVGKRVALKVGLHPDGKRLMIRFRPSVEFYHDVSTDDVEQLSRIIFAFGLNEAKEAGEQRIWVQSYRMEGSGCLLCEGVYNGYGAAIGPELKDAVTGLSGLPAYVILNDGMTSDVLGESDVDKLRGLQEDYNHMVSDDQDALRFNMFPQTMVVDASEESVQSIKVSPAALIDLQTDAAQPDHQAQINKLESQFSYHERFDAAISDMLTNMYALMSCPQVTEEYLKAVGISGKAMRAMYWDLLCRCEERWAEWDTALEWLVRQIVIQEGVYGLGDWTGCKYTIKIEHLYPITDDEEDERKLDMQEVSDQVRSRRSYIDKWLTGVDADEELKQIALEKQLIEESFMGGGGTG